MLLALIIILAIVLVAVVVGVWVQERRIERAIDAVVGAVGGLMVERETVVVGAGEEVEVSEEDGVNRGLDWDPDKHFEEWFKDWFERVGQLLEEHERKKEAERRRRHAQKWAVAKQDQDEVDIEEMDLPEDALPRVIGLRRDVQVKYGEYGSRHLYRRDPGLSRQRAKGRKPRSFRDAS